MLGNITCGMLSVRRMVDRTEVEIDTHVLWVRKKLRATNFIQGFPCTFELTRVPLHPLQRPPE